MSLATTVRRLGRDLGDLPDTDARLIRRNERIAWSAAFGFIVLYALAESLIELLVPRQQQPLVRIVTVAVVTILATLAVLQLTLARSVVLAREQARQRAVLEDAARLHGVLLSARTMPHHLNNQLTLAVGYGELVADDPRLPDDLHELANLALAGAEGAAATLARLRQVTQVREITAFGETTILDLGEPEQ
ncbi:MAG: hypothetical protein HY329_12020 [Chloroflexi bacterium]|nr:hypothetical protein [Chloroflexota bacterium]